MKKLLLSLLFFFPFILLAQEEDYLSKAYNLLYSKKDSAVYYIEKAYDKALKEKSLPDAFNALSYLNMVGTRYNDIGLYNNSIRRQDSIFKLINLDSLETKEPYLLSYWYYQGLYNYDFQNYEKALNSFNQIVNYLEEHKESSIYKEYNPYNTVAYAYIALINRDQKKYEIAEDFYNKALRTAREGGQSIEQQLDYQNLIASLRADNKDYVGSNDLAINSINHYLNTDPDKSPNSLVTTTRLIIGNYINLKMADSARYYLDLIKPYLEKRKNYKQSYIKREARLDLLEGDTITAQLKLKNILDALDFNDSNYEDIVSLNNEIGGVYLASKKLDSAQYHFQNGIKIYRELDNGKRPPIVLELIKSYTDLLRQKTNSSDYKLILEYAEDAMDQFYGLKKTFYSDRDKQVLVENILPILENAIEACYQQYKSSKDQKYLRRAFQLFEQSKSSVLLDAIQNSNAYRFSDIPSEILEDEQLLRIKISQLQKAVELNKDSIRDNELFRAKRDHEKLLGEIENDYPDYYQLKYQDSSLDIKELQLSIGKDETILSFFYGERAIYQLLVTKNAIDISKFDDIEKISETLRSIKKELSKAGEFSSNLKNGLHNLYQRFIPDGIKNKGSLTIIPDGLLRTIPFEAFISDISSMEFLIERFSICYQNSATLAHHLTLKNAINKNILAFAPSFGNNTDSLSKLPFANQEVNNLSNYFDARIYADEKADLQAFKNNLSDYGIIHLATHAIVNDQFPDYSYLAFAPNENEGQLLFQNDLYAMDFNAEMVTLSACETGVGKMRKGEGLMSLSRAFFYSGAKSLVTSLWKINDKTSSELMQSFYKNLSQGKTKEEAAQKSKLEFIVKNRDNPLIHPYYWSGIVVYGDTAAITSNDHWVYLIIGSILALILFAVLLRKKLLK